MIVVTTDMVAIVDATGDLVSTCDGPGSDGTCPGIGEGEIVPCAGTRVLATVVTTARFRLHVPRESRTCPLAWLAHGTAG